MEKEEEKEFVPRVEEYDLKFRGYSGPYLKFYGQSIMYKQAFRWIREKYGLTVQSNITKDSNGDWYWYSIGGSIMKPSVTEGSFDYDDAKLQCLRLLIDIIR